MRHLIQLLSQFLRPASQRFHRALQVPQQAQYHVQQDLFARLVASDYGRSLHLDSLQDWHRIPIVTYDDLQPWIERQKSSQSPLLTSEPILFYERTSGSRGPAKWIPYTRSLKRSFSSMFAVWAYDLLQNGPRFETGKIYFCVSPQWGDPTPSDVPVGLENDAEYLSSWLQWLVKPFLISAPNLNRIRDPEEFKYKLCLALLQEEDLEIISIWNPSFLKIHLDTIQIHRLQLLQDLNGKISSYRIQLLQEPEILWTQLWPNLKLISCWDRVHAADQARLLRSYFPGVMIQGKGLLATEAPITIPLIQAQACLPLLNEVFFEFENAAGEIQSLHEISPGETYSLILSQKGGLYRYRLGDLVQVGLRYLNTPSLEFVGRDHSICDLVGEKLQEDFVRDALKELPLQGSFFQSLQPVSQPSPHYLLLLDRVDGPTNHLAQHLDQLLCRSHHYRQARLLGQLHPPQVWVSPKIPGLIAQHWIRSGKKWGDQKHTILGHQAIAADLLQTIWESGLTAESVPLRTNDA